MLDPLSVVLPARVRCLCLPIGDVRRSRFTSFVDRLQQENVVHLQDVSPDPQRSWSLAIVTLKPLLKLVSSDVLASVLPHRSYPLGYQRSYPAPVPPCACAIRAAPRTSSHIWDRG